MLGLNEKIERSLLKIFVSVLGLILRLAAKDPINAEKTLRMLYEFYASRSDTQELYRVLVHVEKVRPTDLSVRNNLAQISLLLNLNPDQTYRAAREVYDGSRRIRTTRPLMLFHFTSKAT